MNDERNHITYYMVCWCWCVCVLKRGKTIYINRFMNVGLIICMLFVLRLLFGRTGVIKGKESRLYILYALWFALAERLCTVQSVAKFVCSAARINNRYLRLILRTHSHFLCAVWFTLPIKTKVFCLSNVSRVKPVKTSDRVTNSFTRAPFYTNNNSSACVK